VVAATITDARGEAVTVTSDVSTGAGASFLYSVCLPRMPDYR
jgi:hypothetical protein